MNRSPLPTASARIVLTAAALLALTGTALGQNALGGGRSLDGGLSNTPGGRVNASVADLQTIVRFNTNAGNALNGPGFIGTTNRFNSTVGGYGASTGQFSRGTLSESSLLARNGSTFGSPLGTLSSSSFDRVAAIEAGYLPGGSLTSSVNLPQGTTANDYHGTIEPYVGFVRNGQGGVVMARGSSLRGLNLDPVTPPSMAPSDAPKVGTAATYSRVIDELRRASTARALENPNRIDLSANPTATPSTGPKPTDVTAATPPAPADGKTAKADPDATLKRLRDRLAATKTQTKPTSAAPTRVDDRTQPTGVTTPDPSNSAATVMLTEEDINALRNMGIKLDTLVPPGSNDAQATDGYTRLGQEALTAGRFGLADQLFQSALSRSPSNAMAQAGRIHATMGLGLLMTAGSDLRTYFVEHPEMIPVKFETTLLVPSGRAERLADMLTTDIARADGAMLNNGGLTLAYLGRQFDNGAWLEKGFAAMAVQTKNDPQGAELLSILKRVWGAPSVPPAPAAPTTPAAPAAPAGATPPK